MPALAAQLGAAIAVCHETSMDLVPRSLWANAWDDPPAAPPTAIDCYSPLRGLGGAEHLAAPETDSHYYWQRRRMRPLEDSCIA